MDLLTQTASKIRKPLRVVLVESSDRSQFRNVPTCNLHAIRRAMHVQTTVTELIPNILMG
jgi:hypothetical protein